MLIAIIALVIGAALYVVNMVGVNITANVICSLGVLIVGLAMLIKGADHVSYTHLHDIPRSV